MTIELIGELNSDLHPMYFYLTCYIALICYYGLLDVTQYQLTRHKKVVNNHYYVIHLDRQQRTFIIGQCQDIHSWITMKMKRKESPDDDEDNHASSYVKHNQLIRGGQKWNLYSLSLKNIELLGLL